MLNRAAIVVALTFVVAASGFAIRERFNASPEQAPPLSAAPPAPATTPPPAPSEPEKPMAAQPEATTAAGPSAGPPVPAAQPTDSSVPPVTSLPVEETATPAANAVDAATPAPVQQTQTSLPTPSSDEAASKTAPPPLAPAPAVATKDNAPSQATTPVVKEASAPPVNLANAPPPAPVEQAQTLVPTPSSKSQPADKLPTWLNAHVGEKDGQIAKVVLQRARALYREKVKQGTVANSCYFAMDATRPNVLGDGESGRRFYIICEPDHLFRAISAGHGSGRKLKGIADFSNGRRCVKNFGNALDSKLTAGGAYLTSNTKKSFKGYYPASAKKLVPFVRAFLQYEGEGDTANARERQIGGHAAELLRNVCRRKDPHSPYADHDGYVPFGKLVDYASGRSDGCTSWSASDAETIMSMVKDNPTTLYIYPEEADVNAVARAVAAGRSLAHASVYWNQSCLKDIGAPKFWPKETLGPILAQYKKDHPPGPERPIPICKR